MPEREGGGVKGQPAERVGCRPVFPVSCDRMPYGGELYAYLVLPTGLKLDFQKCGPVFLLHDTEIRTACPGISHPQTGTSEDCCRTIPLPIIDGSRVWADTADADIRKTATAANTERTGRTAAATDNTAADTLAGKLLMSFMEQSSRLKAPGADPDTGYQIFSEIKSTVLKKISSILSELLELRLWS